MKKLALVAVLFVILVVIVWVFCQLPFRSHSCQPSQYYVPPNYYREAEEFVKSRGNYRKYCSLGAENALFNLLNQIKFREYKENYFDCSEASARLEWLLEGAGFDALIAPENISNEPHAWVLVRLGGENIAVETTFLTRDNYNPPGVVGTLENQFERSYIYLPEYRGVYYNPKEIHVSLTTGLGPKSGWGWWNVAPYKNEKPFSEWD